MNVLNKILDYLAMIITIILASLVFFGMLPDGATFYRVMLGICLLGTSKAFHNSIFQKDVDV